MKKLILSILSITLFSSVLFAQSATVKRIKVKGNKFVTESGDTLVFRGLNTSDPNKLKNDGHWNKEYFEEIKKWGANIVRFPVHPSAWRSRGQQEYIKLLDEGIALQKSKAYMLSLTGTASAICVHNYTRLLFMKPRKKKHLNSGAPWRRNIRMNQQWLSLNSLMSQRFTMAN